MTRDAQAKPKLRIAQMSFAGVYGQVGQRKHDDVQQMKIRRELRQQDFALGVAR